MVRQHYSSSQVTLSADERATPRFKICIENKILIVAGDNVKVEMTLYLSHYTINELCG